jgi:hypothetical protein
VERSRVNSLSVETRTLVEQFWHFETRVSPFHKHVKRFHHFGLLGDWQVLEYPGHWMIMTLEEYHAEFKAKNPYVSIGIESFT